MSAPITLQGRIAAEPKVTFSKNGKAIVRLFVLTSGRKFVDNTWTDVDTTGWSVVAFGHLAEQLTEAALGKGQAVIVIGKVKEDTWTDKEGNERKGMSVMADTVGLDLRWARSTPQKFVRDLPADDPWAAPLVPETTEAAPF